VHLLYDGQARLPLKLRALNDFAAPRLRQRLADAGVWVRPGFGDIGSVGLMVNVIVFRNTIQVDGPLTCRIVHRRCGYRFDPGCIRICNDTLNGPVVAGMLAAAAALAFVPDIFKLPAFARLKIA